jgi:HlyD family secretion protein
MKFWLPVLIGLAVGLLAGLGWEIRPTSLFRTDAPAVAEQSPVVVVPPVPSTVTALGRLEPKDGVFRVSGPSDFAIVLRELKIDDGDSVQKGQVIAILDSYAPRKANVARVEAELANKRAEYKRTFKLSREHIVSDSDLEQWQAQVRMLEAELDRAKAEADLALVRSPVSGQVLEVHAREGEKVGPDGIAEIAQTQAMYAIAEVYETDVGRVKLGQRATISSPALEDSVQGTVDRIGLKVGKKDVLATDPAARTDARVVEVEILLDDSKRVAGLTNLQVDVAIQP